MAGAALVEDPAVPAAQPPATGATQPYVLGESQQGDADLQIRTWVGLGTSQLRGGQACQSWALAKPLGGYPLEILPGIGAHGFGRRRSLLQGRDHGSAQGWGRWNQPFGSKADRQGPQAQGQANQQRLKGKQGCCCHRQGPQTLQLARSGAQEPASRLPSQSRWPLPVKAMRPSAAAVQTMPPGEGEGCQPTTDL